MEDKINFTDFVGKFFKKQSGNDVVKNLSFLLQSVDNTEFIYAPQKNNGMELIECEDIVYISESFSEKKRKVIKIITEKGEHYYHNSATDIFQFLENNSNCFRAINSEQMVNFHKMHSFNSDLNQVYYTLNGKECFLVACNAAIKGCVKKILTDEKDLRHRVARREYAKKL